MCPLGSTGGVHLASAPGSAAGWWRGPAPRTLACERALQEIGVRCGQPLPDGSWRLRREERAERPDLRLAAGDPDEPLCRAHWISARLAAAEQACAAPWPAPELMAVLNLTPDSFSDGGELQRAGAVAEAAQHRLAEGASWLDLGAESTRPGARPVSAKLQLERLLPALDEVAGLDVRLSVDTRCAEVAQAALERGAAMVNDVSALSDPEMGPLVAERGCRLVLMHMRGHPADMREHASYRFLLGEVLDELAARVHAALALGVRPEQILVDPGIGFAKNAPQSLELIGRLGALRALGLPLLVGPSRKSYLEEVLPLQPPAERDGGSAGAAALCAAQGASILRLHRGGPGWDAVRVAWAAAARAHAAAAGAPPPWPPAATADAGQGAGSRALEAAP